MGGMRGTLLLSVAPHAVHRHCAQRNQTSNQTKDCVVFIGRHPFLVPCVLPPPPPPR